MLIFQNHLFVFCNIPPLSWNVPFIR